MTAFAKVDMAGVSLTRAPTPEWVIAFFSELDDKSYGVGLDVLAENAEAWLGVHHWSGRDAIRQNLKSNDEGVDTRHHVHEFWDGGLVKILRGELAMTVRSTGQVATAVIGHFLYMDEQDPTQVSRWIGAFGPVS